MLVRIDAGMQTLVAQVHEHEEFINGNGTAGAKSRLSALETREKDGCPAVITLTAQMGEVTKKKDRSIGMWVSISLIAISQLLSVLFDKIPLLRK